MIKQGTLVLVLAKELSNISLTDRDMVDENGALWVCVGRRGTTPGESEAGDHALHWYKSLATGEEYLWYDYEVVVAGEEEEANNVS
jgi:hypothetical protein